MHCESRGILLVRPEMGWPQNVARAAAALAGAANRKAAGQKDRQEKDCQENEVKRLLRCGRMIGQGSHLPGVSEHPVIDGGHHPADQAGPQPVAGIMRTAQHL